MRVEEMQGVSEIDLREVVNGWQAPIGKAILETWGLPEALQQALEHQPDLEREPATDGDSGDDGITLTNILVAAKVLSRDPAAASGTPALAWPNIMKDLDAAAVPSDHEAEIRNQRSSLGDWLLKKRLPEPGSSIRVRYLPLLLL